ncbi:MAG: DNA-binding domain-containing protein [Paludibacter sp.]|jgi:hypothetical protein|nr:DNA-binding domain-containing protein [Paludibacter sp.]
MDNVLHRIKVNLYPNLLTEDPNDFSARVISERTLSISDICRTAVSRGGAQTSTSAQAMESNVALFLKEMAYQLCDGFSVNTGYFTANTQLRGVFNSSTETYNPEKHTILFQFNQGELLRKELGNVSVVIDKVGEAMLVIEEVYDSKSGTVNDLLTPNRNLKIRGSKLKIVGENPDNGVYFINTADNTRTKVDPTDIVTNNPSELIVVVPELKAGTYKVEVQTQYAGASVLKEPRSCTFDRILTVQ